MRWTPLLFGSLTVVAMTACNGNKRNNDAGTAGSSGTESGTMQNGAATSSDTGMAATDTTAGGMSGMRSDTATGGARMHSDTSMGTGARSSSGAASTTTGSSNRSGTTGNQTKSGVTDTKTGKSTLGKGVTRTRPDQGQPVTSKGDTVSSGPDSNAANQ
jgi:hypothetical protein